MRLTGVYRETLMQHNVNIRLSTQEPPHTDHFSCHKLSKHETQEGAGEPHKREICICSVMAGFMFTKQAGMRERERECVCVWSVHFLPVLCGHQPVQYDAIQYHAIQYNAM